MILRTAVFTAVLCSSGTVASDVLPRTSAVVFREIARYSVRIRRDNPKNPGAGSGTIVRLTPHGALVLTCAHVVAKESAVLVDIDEEGEDIRTLPGLVDKVDENSDLALVMVLGDTNRPAAPMAKKDPDLYDDLYTVGCPLMIMRQSGVLRVNTMDATLHKRPKTVFWTVSGPMIPGMSGSGVFNYQGELVAVVEAYFGVAQSYSQLGGFVVSSENIKTFLKNVK